MDAATRWKLVPLAFLLPTVVFAAWRIVAAKLQMRYRERPLVVPEAAFASSCILSTAVLLVDRGYSRNFLLKSHVTVRMPMSWRPPFERCM